MKITTNQLKAIIKETVLKEMNLTTTGDEIELVENSNIPGLVDLWNTATAIRSACTEIARFENNPEELEDMAEEMPEWIANIRRFSDPVLRKLSHITRAQRVPRRVR